MTETNPKSCLILNRYLIYTDGVIYDTEKGDDIPQWIFELRDFILTNAHSMLMTNSYLCPNCLKPDCEPTCPICNPK